MPEPEQQPEPPAAIPCVHRRSAVIMVRDEIVEIFNAHPNKILVLGQLGLTTQQLFQGLKEHNGGATFGVWWEATAAARSSVKARTTPGQHFALGVALWHFPSDVRERIFEFCCLPNEYTLGSQLRTCKFLMSIRSHKNQSVWVKPTKRAKKTKSTKKGKKTKRKNAKAKEHAKRRL